jgi:hypothetical protein
MWKPHGQYGQFMFSTFHFCRIYSNKSAVNGLRWHRNIFRTAQTVTAHIIVNQGIPTILRFIMCKMASMDVILNVFSLSYLWEK